MAMRSSIIDPPKRRRGRPIVIIGGDKGGTGKSFGARVVAGWLRQSGYPVSGYDGDSRNGHLERYYQSSLSVFRTSLRDPHAWTLMFKAWAEVPADHVIVVDLPGNIGDMLENQADRLKPAAEGLDRRLISLWVAAEEEDSIWLLKSALQIIEARSTIFWMNGRFGEDASKFELWNRSQTRERFIFEGGVEAFLPVLPIFPRTKVARSRAPFNDVSSASLDYIERIDFDQWWSSVGESLTPLSDMLEGRA